MDFFIEKEKEINGNWASNCYKKSRIFSEEEIKKTEEIKVSYKHLIKKLDKIRLKDIFDRFTV
ncbi:MAG: hypothetical protein QMD85_04980, partial [Candidatus Aenigmarchaeota archaeon]|nr:hypothetical protein [Candidatus Aenigmarchaeota archaeon]